jgi:hypothetical protein
MPGSDPASPPAPATARRACGLGQLRVAEHFAIAGGKIVRLRQIHDTAALRETGFAA